MWCARSAETWFRRYDCGSAALAAWPHTGELATGGSGRGATAADEEVVHTLGEAPQRVDSLLSLVGSCAISGESHASSAGKATAMPSDVVSHIRGVVMVSFHSDQLRGASATPCAWSVVACFCNCWRCHGGSWLILVLLVVELGPAMAMSGELMSTDQSDRAEFF